MAGDTQRSPFDDFRDLAFAAEKAPAEVLDQLAADLENRAIPESGTMGSLLMILGAWQKEHPVKVDEMHICLFASSYAAATPVDAMQAFVKTAKRGAAAVSILAQDHGLGLRILDLAIDRPHEPFEWSEIQSASTLAYGMEAIAAGGDLLGLGCATFGHDAFAFALAAAALRLTQDVSGLLDITTGPQHDQMAALLAGVPDGADPLEAVQLLAGPDISAGLGALMAARAVGIPVLIESAGMLAACAVLKALNPTGLDHVILAATASPAERLLADMLGLSPVLGEDPGVGPGAAIAQAHRIIRGACALQGLRPITPNQLA